MTALSVQPPFPILTDIDGQPLDDGFIFIGVANNDPIANPITVYWDAALTVTATQPIRTRGGYPMNAGVVGRLYVNSDYSIQVQNLNGSTVYSSPVQTERFGDLINTVLSNITALRAVTWPTGRPSLVNLINNWTTGDGGGEFRWDGASTVADNDGVIIKEAATATGRWIRQFGDSQCWPEWFGPVLDNSGDATAPVQAAINYGIASGNEIRLGAKTYICDSLTYTSNAFALMPSIRGASMVRTTIKRLSSGTNGQSVLYVSTNAATNFVANMSISDLTIDGLNSTKSTVGIEFTAPVRLSVSKVKSLNCYHGFYVNGGVGTRFNECYLNSNVNGITFSNYAGTLGVNWPNYHQLNSCVITENVEVGVYFDGGRQLIVQNCDIESNGITANFNTGGLIVGPNVDIESGGLNSIGVKVYDCWFEANRGIASVAFKSGKNAVLGCNFVANPNSDVDIHVSGGSYILSDIEISSSKATAVYQDPAVANGNFITRVTGITASQFNIDRAKTKLDQLGRVGTLANLTAPTLGERAVITDSATSAAGNFFVVIAGGGANSVPATYDGTNWRIG